jgi:hypothetical protein
VRALASSVRADADQMSPYLRHTGLSFDSTLLITARTSAQATSCSLIRLDNRPFLSGTLAVSRWASLGASPMAQLRHDLCTFALGVVMWRLTLKNDSKLEGICSVS